MLRRDAVRSLRDAAIEVSANAFVVTDITLPDHPIVDVNAAFERTTGYAPREVIGHNCRFLQGSGTDPQAVERIRQAVRARAEAIVVLLNYRKDGTPFWNELYLAPMAVGAGDVTHYVGVQSDVTARVRAAELEAALAAEREAGRLKTAFLDTMSHELRTPLTAILGYAELLAMGPLAPEQEADLAAIAGGGTRLLGLIDDVLRLADLEAGRSAPAVDDVALGVLLEDVAARFAAAAAAKGLTLRVEASAGLRAMVEVDGLDRALAALLDNAVRFTERGGVTVAARPDDGHVSIAIADTGIGVAPEVLPHVFAAFRQADASSTRRHGGAGLGLAIAKRLVELSGGSISVASEPGAGSIFTVRLPTATGRGRSGTS